MENLIFSLTNGLQDIFFSAWPIQMFAVMLIIMIGLGLYMRSDVAVEFTSLSVIIALMLLFYFFPMDVGQFSNPHLQNILPTEFLNGFSNPALITVLSLLVLGEGLDKTGVLERLALKTNFISKGKFFLTFLILLFMVMVLSAFLNNTPLVVILIPLLRSVAKKSRRSPSALMMPLSFAAILGGTTTLIGSSTNLLVSATLENLGHDGLGFFSFFVPAAAIAFIGFLYIIFIMPYLLPKENIQEVTKSQANRQFKAQILVRKGSSFIDLKSIGGAFPQLKDFTILSMQRKGKVNFPPFDDITLSDQDILVVAATREPILSLIQNEAKGLVTDLSNNVYFEDSDPLRQKGIQSTAEVIVPRHSALVNRSLRDIDFRFKYHCVVLGIERRNDLMRERLIDTPIKDGDTLLLQGNERDIEDLRSHRDIVLLEWTQTNLGNPIRSIIAASIFLLTIAAIGFELLPIVTATLIGACAMVAFRILPLVDAVRAIDYRIMLLIASALAMGIALQNTGGADFIVSNIFRIFDGFSQAIMLSILFLLIALITNILSNNATAVLFTPIAVALAESLNAPIMPFAVAVIIAANCSFSTPIGYQTNMLVMGPGGYRFMDYVKAGTPLTIICWLSFSIIAPLWWGLNW